MEIDWYCPKCKWWISEHGLKDEEYGFNFTVHKDGLYCPKDGTLLETRPAEFVYYTRRACDKPRVSQAMGIRPEDILVAMKKWPGSQYRGDGALLISGRTEKKIRMKQRGLVETD